MELIRDIFCQKLHVWMFNVHMSRYWSMLIFCPFFNDINVNVETQPSRYWVSSPELNCEVGVARALSFIFYISSHDNSFPLLTIMNKWEHRNNINVIKLTESKRLLVMLISWCYNQTPSTTKVYLSWFPQLTHRSSIVKDCPHLVQSLVHWREILFRFSQTVFFCFYSRVFWFSSMFMTLWFRTYDRIKLIKKTLHCSVCVLYQDIQQRI